MDRPRLMSIDPQRAQTLSAVSTVLSAFLVFVLGGGAVLKIWVDERKAARAMPAVQAASVEEVKATAQTETVSAIKARPVQRSSKPKVTKGRAAERAPAKRVTSTKKAKAARTESPPPKPAEPVSGKGQVMIRGDAARVRLIGSNGTFGSGTVPAGSYTIQAIFSGGDPRHAGTVQVSDGQRIIIVCKAAGQRCVQR